MWKGRRGADKNYGVAIDQAGDRRDVSTVCRSWTGNKMDFDAEI